MFYNDDHCWTAIHGISKFQIFNDLPNLVSTQILNNCEEILFYNYL